MNNLNKFSGFERRQDGAALFMALVFLIIITMVSLSAMHSSVMELRMAGNAESKTNAEKIAQSLIDATVANINNTPVVGSVGDMTCLPSATNSHCTRKTIALQDSSTFSSDVTAGYANVEVTRLSPLSQPAPRTQGYSLKGFSVATFQVDGTYNASSVGLGNAEIVEGLLVLIAN